MAQRLLLNLGRIGGGVGVAAVVLPSFLFDVDGGERAVMVSAYDGVMPKPIGEGTHFMIPYLYTPYIMSVRAEPREIKSRTGTKDLQMVNIALRILTKPKEEKLPWIYKELGLDFNNRVYTSIGMEVLKATVAKYNAEELLSKRQVISNEIRDKLAQEAANFNLELVDVAITQLLFGKEFSSAIEAKQVAQQEADRQKWVVERADFEKKANIIRAEGEAEAAKIISAAVATAGSGIIEVRRIDTAKEIAGLLAQSRNVTYLPSNQNGNNMLLGLDTK